jgi:hypothetical protein
MNYSDFQESCHNILHEGNEFSPGTVGQGCTALNTRCWNKMIACFKTNAGMWQVTCYSTAVAIFYFATDIVNQEWVQFRLVYMDVPQVGYCWRVELIQFQPR